MTVPAPLASRPAPTHAAAAAATLLFCACSGGGSSSPSTIGGLPVFSSKTADFASPQDTPLVVGDQVLAYLASESASGASDLNGDGDALDRVAVGFDRQSDQGTPLAAAQDLVLVGEELFLVVDEAQDGRDWSGDAVPDDLVLLHWSRGDAAPEHVDVLRRAPTVVADDRLYYSAEPAAMVSLPDTTLHYVEAAAPTTPVMVSAAGAVASQDPIPMGAAEGLVLLAQDETLAMIDLNGDGDATDGVVLALLDGSEPAALLRSVGLALSEAAPTIAAVARAAGDWLVAFLVDEAAQGATNLNDPALFLPSWQPPQCSGLEDADAQDRVLHFLEFAAWDADPLASPPVNTGLVGDRRALAAWRADLGRSFVATLSPEDDEGSCALNGDGDQGDTVLRWAEVLAAGAFTPETDADLILATATVPGGVRGLVEDQGRLFAVVSEADDDRDHDGDSASDVELLGWVDPAQATPAWTFPEHASLGTPLGVDWMADDGRGPGFLFTDVESVIGIACNAGDSDMDDSFALAGVWDAGTPGGLRFNGYCYAVEPFNAGAVLVGNVCFLRADEAEQGRDLNEDGDLDDQVLLLHTVFPLGTLRYVGTLNALPGPAVTGGEEGTVAWLADEAMAGRDLNGDGDQTDWVVRYLRLQ